MPPGFASRDLRFVGGVVGSWILAPPCFHIQYRGMKQLTITLACLLPIAKLQAQGHASATWITEKSEVVGGEAVRTAIRVKVDEGWHAYWENPGVVGMPFTLDTDFPEGWETGEIQYPAPKRITVSGLISFCLKGEFLLPVTVTPPSGFSGKLPEVRATLKWLACNDDSCVPGKAEITAQPADDPGTIAAAYAELPKPIPGSLLTADVDGDSISLTLTLPDDAVQDPAACEVFPITRNIIDPAANIAFTKSEDTPNTWHVSVAKDEYFPDEIGEIRILLIADDKASFVVGTE